MIVNPYDPQSTNQQTNLMTFNTTPEMGYYAGPAAPYGYYAAGPEMSYDGYYGEPAGYGAPYGYYAAGPEMSYDGYSGEPPEMMGYYAAEPGAYGYYADPPEMMGYYAAEPGAYGYYADQPGVGWHADSPEMRYYGNPGYGYSEPGIGYYGDQYDPIGYYADEWPMGWYGDSPDLPGYGDYQPLSDYGDEMSYYAEPEMAGYVRQTAPVFNPGCPIPTNVAGYGEHEQFSEGDPLSGYQRPKSVNASCEQFTPQPGVRDFVPETFKPLW